MAVAARVSVVGAAGAEPNDGLMKAKKRVK
jgi:hypothetical protein